MNKFTYKVYGVKGSVAYTDFLPDMEIVIYTKKLFDATDKIKQYLADNFLQCDKTELVKIELAK